MQITKEGDKLQISITVPLTMKGTETYGDGEWTAPAVCVRLDDNLQDYGLFYTQYLDYKDSLQATSPIAYFESKEEAVNAATMFGLPIEEASR